MENVNAERYLHLVQNQVLLAIQNVVGIAFNNVWFQQNGAPTQFGKNVRQIIHFQENELAKEVQLNGHLDHLI